MSGDTEPTHMSKTKVNGGAKKNSFIHVFPHKRQKPPKYTTKVRMRYLLRASASAVKGSSSSSRSERNESMDELHCASACSSRYCSTPDSMSCPITLQQFNTHPLICFYLVVLAGLQARSRPPSTASITPQFICRTRAQIARLTVIGDQSEDPHLAITLSPRQIVNNM